MHERRDRGGETGRGGDDLVAGLQWALDAAGAQGGDGEQIGRGAGVNREGASLTFVVRAQKIGQSLLEGVGARANGEPEIQHRIDGSRYLALVVDAAGVMDPRLAGLKGPVGVGRVVIFDRLGYNLTA